MNVQYKTIIHAPDIKPKYRHQSILQSFDRLAKGEALLLSNDHDPKPLHYQLKAERSGIFKWNYVKEGPYEWCVEIKRV